MQKNHPTQKKFSLIFLCLFCFSFPILEGVSNTYFAVGSVSIGFASSLVWALESIYKKNISINLSGILLLCFTAWSAITIFWSFDLETSLAHVKKIFLSFILYIIVFDTARNIEDISSIIKSYLAGIFLVSLSATINIFTGTTYGELSNRYSADGFDPNNFGLILCSAIPLFLISTNPPNINKKLVSTLAILLFSFLIISSASRAAFAALVIILPLTMLTIATPKNALKSIPFLLVILLFLIPNIITAVPELALNRILTSKITDDAGGGRFTLWLEALDSSSILFGNGPGTFLLTTGSQPHSTFISSLYECGVIGFILWTAFWLSHIHIATPPPPRDTFGKLIGISTIPILIAAATLNWEFRKPLYLMLAICSAYLAIHAEKIAPSKPAKIRTLQAKNPVQKP